MELAPELVDVLLLVGHGDVFHQMVADGGVGTVCTNHEVEGDFYFGAARGVRGGTSFEPCKFLLQVDAQELVAKVKSHVGHRFEMVQESLV